VTSLVTRRWCCASVNLFWSVWFNWFNHFFAWSIFSKRVFHICSLDILSNNSQAFTSISHWVRRLFKSFRNTSESCLIQCCNCFTFFISQKIEAFRDSFFIFYFFIKCMQPMAMALSRRCMYAKLHVTWPKSLLYIFSLVNHTDSLRIQALSLKPSSSYSRFPLSLRTLRVLLFRF